MSSAESLPAPFAAIQRRMVKTGHRATARFVATYLHTVGLRGRLTRPELLAVRGLADQLIAVRYPGATDVTVAPVRARFEDGQVRGEWHEAPAVGRRNDAVVLYVHGGGFVFGSPTTHLALTGELSRRLGWPVFSLDYRLAPEHPFPAGADDVLRAYCWLLARGVPADRVVVAGDSAGGHLSLGLPPRAARAGVPVPGAVVAFSPAVDPAFTAAAGTVPAPDRLIPVRAAKAIVREYDRGRRHPELRLADDDLSVMPPVLIQTAQHEFCAPDAAEYAAALRTAGGDVQLRTFPRTWHVFQLDHGRVRAARTALDEATAFVQRHLPPLT